MGCFSSKPFSKNPNPETHIISCCAYSSSQHIVSLKSSTYGLLNLDSQPSTKINPIISKTETSMPIDDLDLLPPEVINAWELMKGLEDEIPRKSPKYVARSPLKILNHANTPMKVRRVFGKENSEDKILSGFQKKCPPGGENKLIIYTTTLRGIRKTFEECNLVRGIIESKSVQAFERDVSMDAGFKDELKKLMGEARVPIVFVKGRLIGGAEEIMRLEEEGKLGVLLDGIPREVCGCRGCAGVRFVMCMNCNGSCKLRRDDDEKKVVRCGQCNENGLIQCPICCRI